MNTALIFLLFILLFTSMFLVKKYCKKKPLKITLAIIISLIAIWLAMFSIDFNRTATLREPIFARENGTMGSMTRYDGIGYKIGLEKSADTGEVSQSQMTMLGMFVVRSIADTDNNATGIKKIDNSVIDKLSATKKIIVVIESDNKKTGTLTDENIIQEIISIMSKASGNINGFFTCPGTSLYYEMYDINNKLIDSVDIWIDGSIMPKSIATGCARYSLKSEDIKTLNTITEETIGTKFYTIYDYSEDCNDALELIYENKDFKYYFTCIKSDKMFIEFTTNKQKMTIKDALKNNYININELVEDYPDLFYKESK
jgi:hypothetical protein